VVELHPEIWRPSPVNRLLWNALGERGTVAPKDIEESLDRAVILPNFSPTPDQIMKLRANRTKNQILPQPF